MSKMTLKMVNSMIQAFRVEVNLDGENDMGNDGDIINEALRLLAASMQPPKAQDPSAAWDALRAQLWGARPHCQDAWQKMVRDIKGIDRNLMAQAVQVAQVDEKLRLNFSREFYLNHRQACHSTIAYWVAAARHLGHTSRPGKRDDGSGYVEFSLEPSTE